jgi:predicted nucleic acid-binding protein
MKSGKTYVDTSVFGGAFDVEFERPSRRFFEEVKLGFFDLVISPIVGNEIEDAPSEVRSYYARMLPIAEVVDVTVEALKLRNAYLDAKVVSRKYADDALHVALASVCGCRMIVSWNFRHIVHFDKIRMYHAVNLLNGYEKIDIFTPSEVIHYDEDI